MNKKRIYWGYIDVYDKVHVKLYRDDRQIENAEAFPLTKGIFDPFTAKNLAEAKLKIMNKYAEEILSDRN
jgi:hypothetical protein